MANSKYNAGREATALKQINYNTDTFVLIALDASYRALAWSDDDGFLGVNHTIADLVGIIDTATLSGKTVDFEGRMYSNPVVFPGIGVGQNVACMVLRNTTVGHLIAFYDSFEADQELEIAGDGTPVTLNGPVSGWVRI
jgi:hypothetical protein